MSALLLVDFGDSELSRLVAHELRGQFEVEIMFATSALPRTRMRERQMNGEDMLSEVVRIRQEHGAALALGFTDRDLYVPGMNFIFGLASRDEKVGIVSAYRLGSREPEVLRLRLLKETVHELGHLYGLAHCANPLCVMHFSNSLADTDHKSPDFCSRCEHVFSQGFRST